MARDLTQPLRELKLLVTDTDHGERLDQWLARRLPWRSRADLVARIATGRILLDDAAAKKSHRLRQGETVRVFIDDPLAPAAERACDLRFLYEDDWLLALDKPSGAVVHPVGGHVSNTLLNALHQHYKSADSLVRPMIVHRLDKETSGVLVLAKDERTRRDLGRDFEERRVEKSYLAFVKGRPPENRGVVDQPIGPDPASPGGVRMAIRPEGRPSITDYEVIEFRGGFSAVRCRPHTGRQHQIRVHMAALGTPVLGDWLYGDAPPVLLETLVPKVASPRVVLERLALHAEELGFEHPGTKEPLRIRSPLPADLGEMLRLVDEILPR